MTKLEVIKGLVRPFIAVAFVSATLAMFLLEKQVPAEMLTVTGMVVSFYFAERATKNGSKTITPQV